LNFFSTSLRPSKDKSNFIGISKNEWLHRSKKNHALIGMVLGKYDKFYPLTNNALMMWLAILGFSFKRRVE